MNENETKQSVLGPIDAVIVHLIGDGKVIMRNLATDEEKRVSFNDDTVLLEMTFGEDGDQVVSERRMDSSEIGEGDSLVIFLDKATEKVVKALKMANEDRQTEDHKIDPFAERTRAIGLDYIEILSLSRGYKPLIFDVIRKDKKAEFLKVMEEMGIEYRFVDKASVVGDKANILKDGSEFFMISKDVERIKEFKEVYFEDDRTERMARIGELLGYPKCCSKSYVERIRDKDPETRIRDLYFQAVEASGSFSPFNNSIFCFYGRGNHDVGQKMSLMASKNDPRKLMGFGQLFLISHAPCSFDCRESEDYAKKVYGLLKEKEPNRIEAMMRIFTKPVLFFNMFEFIVLDGEASRHKALYRGISYPFSLVDDTVLEKVNNGDELTVHDDRIEIMRGGSLIHTIAKNSKEDGFLIPFENKI